MSFSSSASQCCQHSQASSANLALHPDLWESRHALQRDRNSRRRVWGPPLQQGSRVRADDARRGQANMASEVTRD